MNAQDIEIALSGWFNYRQNLIVPNVTTGVVYHECDMLILTPSGYLTEIEIKVTKQDLKADFKKKHRHYTTPNIKQFFYCYPESMKDCDILIPANAGIIHIEEIETPYGYQTKILRPKFIRQAKINKGALPLSDKDRMSLMRLGCMRIWSLKRKLAEVRHNKNNNLATK